MSQLKDQVQADLTAAIRGRETRRADTLRAVLTAVRNAEVSGTAAHEVTDAEVLAVIAKEAKKRREAAGVYADAGRGELAEAENAELAVLETYLPAQLNDVELADVVRVAVAQTQASGASGPAAMGVVMKAVRAQVGDRADGPRIATAVKQALAS